MVWDLGSWNFVTFPKYSLRLITSEREARAKSPLHSSEIVQGVPKLMAPPSKLDYVQTTGTQIIVYFYMLSLPCLIPDVK